MKNGLIFSLMVGAALGAFTQCLAQSTPVSLSPNEYNDHPQKVPASPRAYTAPGASEFQTTPMGAGVLFTQWQRGRMLDTSDANDGYAARKFIKDSSANGPAVAIDSNSYFYFSVKVSPDYAFTLSDITWKMRRSPTGPKYAQWQYATQSNGFVFQNLSGVLSLAGSSQMQTFTISPIPALEVAGGSSGDSVVFRVLAWGASNGNGTMRIMNGTSFNGAVLPLTLLSFEVQARQEEAVLLWETADESNVQGFSAETSRDARQFQPMGFISAKNELRNSYRFAAPMQAGTNYYRLKMTDLDGSFTYSPVRALHCASRLPVMMLYPNPAQNALVISPVAKGAQLLVHDALGRQVLYAVAPNENGWYSLGVQSLMPGAYRLTVVQAGSKQVLSFVKR